jgi:hypothetical protein
MYMKSRFLAISCIALAATALGTALMAGAGEKPGIGTGHSAVVPQLLVVCTGWHALCSGTTDCQWSGDEAACDCWRVNETHIVATSEIQDPGVKRRTETRCTNRHPCAIDEAPVCGAIADGQYEVDGVRYPWVSTFSYRGWCSLYEPKACDPAEDGYSGDYYWAICDAAPCTELMDPPDPDRPLRCQCPVLDGPFVGTKNSCTGDDGGIISAMPLWIWDFDQNTWAFPMPGFDYVKPACDPLQSDPLPE